MLLMYSAHIAICTLVILVILFQDGKTGGLTGVADNASQQVFGAKGAGNFLTKLTTGLAVAFMITSLTLALFHKTDDKSIAEDYKPDVLKTETPSVELPKAVSEEQAVEIEGSGDVTITEKDGTQRKATLNEAVKDIEILKADEVPEEIREAHRKDRANQEKKKLEAFQKKKLANLNKKNEENK